MDPVTRQRLLDLNRWHLRPEAWPEELALRIPANFVERHIDLRGLGDINLAKLVVGPRQAGKSTWVWSRIRGEASASVLVVNAEDLLLRAWGESAIGMLADIQREFPSVKTVFLEEVQHFENAGLLIKGLVDGRRGLQIWATGSSVYHLQDKVRESLAGRAMRRRILPFSTSELVNSAPHLQGAAAKVHRQEVARTQLLHGGYPAVNLSPEPERLLRELIEAFVIRDASDRFRIRFPEVFRRLLQLLAGQVGQMANLNEWATILGISGDTVRDYLTILEESWVVKLLPPFAGGRRREVTSATRVHFYDCGVRNALLGAFGKDLGRRPDRGALFETYVFGALSKLVPPASTLYYWRSKGGAELDFVWADGPWLAGIEVKASSKPALSRSSRSFIDAYDPALLVLVGDVGCEPKLWRVGGTQVQVVPLENLEEVCLATEGVRW